MEALTVVERGRGMCSPLTGLFRFPGALINSFWNLTAFCNSTGDLEAGYGPEAAMIAPELIVV